MNQYLQRMASSAIKPGGTIHPIIDSVYSNRRAYSYKPWIDEDESVADTIVEQRLAGLQGSEMPATAAPLQTARIIDPSPLPKPIINKIEPTVTEELRPRGSSPSFVPGVENETIARANNADLLVASSKTEAGTTGEQTVSGEVQRTEFLRPEIDAAPSSSRATKIVLPHQNPTAFVPKARRSQQPGSPVGEPHEIQIHIGRIEVTAVPQAPVPAIAKPQRNVPSLDEYLKRRDRRAP